MSKILHFVPIDPSATLSFRNGLKRNRKRARVLNSKTLFFFFFFLLSYQFYYHNLMLLVLKCTQHSSLATIFSTRSSILPTTSYEQTQHIQFQNSFFTDVLANFPNDRFFDTRLREELTSKAV